MRKPSVYKGLCTPKPPDAHLSFRCVRPKSHASSRFLYLCTLSTAFSNLLKKMSINNIHIVYEYKYILYRRPFYCTWCTIPPKTRASSRFTPSVHPLFTCFLVYVFKGMCTLMLDFCTMSGVKCVFNLYTTWR